MRHARPAPFPLVVLLLLLGCMGEPPSKPTVGLPPQPAGEPPAPVVPPPPPDTAAPVDPEAGDVTLARTERYLTPQGETVRAEAVGTDVEALVFDGTRYLRYPVAPGSAPGAGRVVLPGVPEGEYLLRMGTRYVLTSARQVELGITHGRRPDVDSVAMNPATASVYVEGLSPWNGEPSGDPGVVDALHLTAVESGGLASVALDVSPVAGTTALLGESARLFAERTPTFPVLRGDGSDTLVLSQLGRRSSDAGPYLASRAAATFPAPAFDGWSPLRLDATLQPLAQQALQVDLRAADFAAHAAAVHPQATLIDTRFLVHSAPYGLGYGWVIPSSPLLTLVTRAGQEANRTLALQYGDPFPASWGRVGVALARFAVPFTLASGKVGLAGGFISHEDALERLVRGPVAPEVRHASALRVDGADAAGARTLASSTPTVSWEPPVAGAAPTAYTLQVVRVSDPGGAASVVRSVRADLLLPASARSVRLPEGILASGGEYYLSLTAWRAPSWDFTRQPFTYGFPNSTATRVSGLLSVP